MKQIILSLFTLFCSISLFSQSNSSRDADITGLWHAEAHYSGDVVSIDTFIVLKFEGNYGIVCTSYEFFGVTEIHRAGNNLDFIMLNTLSKDNIYILDYHCKIINEDKIKCRFVNQIGEIEEDITWTRIVNY